MTEAPKTQEERPEVPLASSSSGNNGESTPPLTQEIEPPAESSRAKIALQGIARVVARRRLKHIDDTLDYIESLKSEELDEEGERKRPQMTAGARKQADKHRYRNTRRAAVNDNLMMLYGERPVGTPEDETEAQVALNLLGRQFQYNRNRSAINRRSEKINQIETDNTSAQPDWTNSLLEKKAALEEKYGIEGRLYVEKPLKNALEKQPRTFLPLSEKAVVAAVDKLIEAQAELAEAEGKGVIVDRTTLDPSLKSLNGPKELAEFTLRKLRNMGVLDANNQLQISAAGLNVLKDNIMYGENNNYRLTERHGETPSPSPEETPLTSEQEEKAEETWRELEEELIPFHLNQRRGHSALPDAELEEQIREEAYDIVLSDFSERDKANILELFRALNEKKKQETTDNSKTNSSEQDD